MEKQKLDFATVASQASKSALNFFQKAGSNVAKAIDQDGDGDFDLADASIIANTLVNAAQSAANSIRADFENRARETTLKRLSPVFKENIEAADFQISKLIRIVYLDKERAENELCKGSIGYWNQQKDMKVLCIFRNCIDDFNIHLYPETVGNNEVYYADPCDRNTYIALDDYFNRLKILRVSELQKIAQILGAKHFEVKLKEKEASLSDRAVRASGKLAVKYAINSDFSAMNDCHCENEQEIEISASMDFPGHAPANPLSVLKYLKEDESIINLVDMRLHSDSPLLKQTLSIRLSNSSGLKESEAVKIDATLKGMGIHGNITVADQARTEARRYFWYEIIF